MSAAFGNPREVKAILNIEDISRRIDELAEKDIRGDLDQARIDVPEEKRVELTGTILASDGVRIKRARHWTADSSPYSIEFRGKGIVSVDLPWKTGSGKVDLRQSEHGDGEVFFVTVSIRPALSRDPNELSYLFVEGAVLGFGLEPPTMGIRAGNIFVLNGGAESAALSDWFNAGISYPVDESYQTSMPLNLTLRIDPQHGEWDLFLMNSLKFAGIRFGDSLKKMVINSAGTGTTIISELALQSENPFFDDADSDGIEDAVEEEFGFSVVENDRDALDELGEFTNLQHFMNRRTVYRSRTEKELEETLLEAAALKELGRGLDSLKEREIPDEIRSRHFTKEEYEQASVTAARKLKKFGRPADDTREESPVPGVDGKEGG